MNSQGNYFQDYNFGVVLETSHGITADILDCFIEDVIFWKMTSTNEK